MAVSLERFVARLVQSGLMTADEVATWLTYSNIVTACHAGEHEGIHSLVMEYLDGKDLAQVPVERGALPTGEAVCYM
jgi:serine/threonine protein kinase